jgi:hypothetical protein
LHFTISQEIVVAPVVYDQFGREVTKYLSYTAQTGNTQDGGFKPDPFTDQQNFFQNVYPSEQPAYTGEQVYYGQTNYETSPMNRVQMTLAPGNSWAGSSADVVQLWNIGFTPLTYANSDITTNIPTTATAYDAGQLYKNVTIDEQGHAVVEFKDKEGQVVLKRVQVGTVASDYSGNSGWLSTYYIYDDLNQLRFVIPPKAVAAMLTAGSWTLSTDMINELCFRYEYDYRKRMMAKKVPGAGWVYMVYDFRDRLVFTQDARMALTTQWLGTLYDAINRPVSTGMINYSGTPNQLQSYVTANTNSSIDTTTSQGGSGGSSLPVSLDLSISETGDFQALDSIILDNGFVTPDGAEFTAEIVTGGSGASTGSSSLTFVDNPIPSGSTFTALTMSFYDDYSQTTDKQYTTQYNAKADAGANLHAEDLPSQSDQQAVQTRGLL